MNYRRSLFVLALLCACDSPSAPSGNDSGAAPLAPDLVAACPDSERFERSGKDECTAIGCQSGFSLSVSPSSGWAPGSYRFELNVDGLAVTCDGVIPLQGCAGPSFSCDADGVRLGESGCALDPAQHGIASVLFDGYPRALSIRVVKDGAEVTNTQLTPSYKAIQPNGPGCDPICCSASGELTVPVRR